MATSQILEWVYYDDEPASIRWTRDNAGINIVDDITGNSYTLYTEGRDAYSPALTVNGEPVEWPENTPYEFTGSDNLTLTATIATSEYMAVDFMQSTAERDRVDKTAYLTTMFTQSGHLRDACEITAPVIVFEYPGGQMPLFNYVYIPRLHRYYYLEKLVIIDTGLYEMYLKVDVLNTYKDTIKAQSGIVARNQYDYDTDITDTQRPLGATPVIARVDPSSTYKKMVLEGNNPLSSSDFTTTVCYVITVVTTST